MAWSVPVGAVRKEKTSVEEMSVHFDIKYRPFLLNAKHDVEAGLGHLS